MTVINATTNATSEITVKDNPDELRNTSIKILPAYVGVTTGKESGDIKEDATVPVGWGVELNLREIPFVKKLGFNMKYLKSYLEIPEKLDADGEKIRSTYFEMGGSFNFYTKEKEIEQRLVLSSSSNGRTTTTNFLEDVSMTQKTHFDVTGGIFRVKSPVEIANVTSVVTAFGVYGGLRFTNKVNYSALVSGYGIKKFAARNSWYVNAMYAPSIEYTDETSTYIPGTTVFETKKVMDSIGLINNLGFVLGYELEFFPNKRVSMSVPFELGIKPPFNGYYIYMGFSLNINLNVTPKMFAKKD